MIPNVANLWGEGIKKRMRPSFLRILNHLQFFTGFLAHILEKEDASNFFNSLRKMMPQICAPLSKTGCHQYPILTSNVANLWGEDQKKEDATAFFANFKPPPIFYRFSWPTSWKRGCLQFFTSKKDQENRMPPVQSSASARVPVPWFLVSKPKNRLPTVSHSVLSVYHLIYSREAGCH